MMTSYNCVESHTQPWSPRANRHIAGFWVGRLPEQVSISEYVRSGEEGYPATLFVPPTQSCEWGCVLCVWQEEPVEVFIWNILVVSGICLGGGQTFSSYKSALQRCKKTEARMMMIHNRSGDQVCTYALPSRCTSRASTSSPKPDLPPSSSRTLMSVASICASLFWLRSRTLPSPFLSEKILIFFFLQA